MIESCVLIMREIYLLVARRAVLNKLASGFYVKAAEIEGSMANGDPIDSSIDS